jgi:lysozyme
MKHNRGDYEGASNEFLKYVKAGGKVLKGLVKRRNDERTFYLS